MKILLAQLEIRTGDLEGNTQKIIDVMRKEDGRDADIIVFPELAVTGYNCGALFESEEFVKDALLKVSDIVEKTKGIRGTVIFGAPRFANPAKEPNGNIRLYNSAFVARQGEIVGIYDKTLLANDFQHEDRKYFIPGDDLLTFDLKEFSTGRTAKAGVLICEDIWSGDHDRDLVAEMKAADPDMEMVFCINYSYFTYNKHEARKKILSATAQKNNVDVFYVNAVGVGDIVKNFMVYDGHSLIYRRDGKLIDWYPAFSTYAEVIDWDHADEGLEMLSRECDETKYERIWEALSYSLREIMEQSGVKNAQVHVSGGIDSAVVAALCAKTLGPGRCFFITNPSKYNGSETKSNAQHIADILGVRLLWVPIGNGVDGIEEVAMDTIDCALPIDYDHPKDNKMVATTLEAVGRTMLGLSLSHMFKTAIIATGNHSENVLGWFSFHDVGSIGLYQPLGDLTKSEVNLLAQWINKHFREEIIPTSLYDGTMDPLAELADSKQDPFDYKIYSGICAEIIRHRMTPRDLMTAYDERKLTKEYFPECNPYDYSREVFEAAAVDAWNRSKRSVFKCAQSAPTLIMSPRSRGFSSRETIINFYKQETL